MNGLEQIILNRVQCKECGEVLTSYHGHDYKTCGCYNETMVDGGTNYQRYGGKNLDLVDRRSTVYLSDDHIKNRAFAHWGNRGKDGKQELSYKPIAEMSNDHLTNIIKDMGGKIAPWIEDIMKNEIEHRITNNITIDD
jgi:two-component sensor histidine kinase